VRDTLIALYRLQKIDSEAQQFSDEAERIPDQVRALENSLDKVRSEVGRLNAEAAQLRNEATELEGHVSEESAKHQKWKRRLNDIKSPREYQALSRELEMGERQVGEQEDRLLELGQQIEDKEKAAAEKKEELEQQEREVSAKIRTLRQEEQRLRNEAAERARGRDAVRQQLNERVLKKYEQLRKARSGIAVAVVRGGTCTACQMTVRPQLVVQLLRLDSLESCPNCNRLLVHEQLADEIDGRGAASTETES
jgi:hypothetical protein